MAEENRYRFEEEQDKENVKEDVKEENKNEATLEDQLKDDLENKEKTDKEDKKSKNKKLLKQIEELEAENKKLKADILLVKADEINFKKRIEQEKDNLVKYGNQKLLEKLVNELDLFDKVISMPTDDPVLKNYLIGFEMINNNFKNILSEEGVKKIKITVGEEFNPVYHHVLQTEWNEEYKENAILAELRGGYIYKDRVLCTSLVKINKKEENKEEDKENK